MRNLSIILSLLFSFHCTCGRAQDNIVPATKTPVDLLDDYLQNFHTEKVYVSHDKPSYAPGETIWCKVFMLDGTTHQPFAATPVVYADWISPSGTILNTFTLQIKNGRYLPYPPNKTTSAMHLGAFSASLSVKDLSASREFYEALGFTVYAGEADKGYHVMKNGNALIGIFQGMFEGNILTFNPG